MSSSRKGGWRPFVVLTVALTACEHAAWTREDTFPGRLRQGCSTLEHCEILAREAWGRLRDCRQYWVGTRLRYRTQRLERCTYEMRDFDLAATHLRRMSERPLPSELFTGKVVGPAVPIADGPAPAATPPPPVPAPVAAPPTY